MKKFSFFFLFPSLLVGQTLDFGDLPETGGFATLLANDGPRHTASTNLFIGNTAPDTETDGSPNATATGDDSTGADETPANLTVTTDYSQIGATGVIITQIQLNVTNFTGTAAELKVFADLNSDGVFSNSSPETQTFPVPNGQITAFGFGYGLPPVAYPSTGDLEIPFRIRVSTQTGLLNTGAASDGEVEDHFIDFGSLDDIPPPTGGDDFGDLPETSGYATLLANNGPRHTVSTNLFIGSSAPDSETDSAPNATATGDDLVGADENPANFIVTPDFSQVATTGFVSVQLEFTATNITGNAAEVRVFGDLNLDGTFSSDVGNPETITRSSTSGFTTGYTLNYNIPQSLYPVSGNLEVPFRFRISTQTGLANTGAAPDGEVEDHILNFGSLTPPSGDDFGDLPDTTAGTSPGDFSTATPPDYRTLLSDNGPRHALRPGLFVEEPVATGSSVDSESDGQQSADARGDDNSGSNDEFPTLPSLTNLNLQITNAPFSVRVTGTFELAVSTTNTTGDDAYLTAWVDLDYDGDFESGEAITTGTGLVTAGSGQQTTLAMPFDLPLPALCSLVDHPLYFPVRIRLSTQQNLGPYGAASDGEVVDHLFDIAINANNLCSGTPDYGDLPDSATGTAPGSFGTGTLPDYRVRFEDGGPYHFPFSELAFADSSGGTPDREPDGQPSADASGDGADEDGLLAAVVKQDITVLTTTPSVTARADIDVLVSLPLTNTTGFPAFVHAWMDGDLDGDFEASEKIAIGSAATVPGDGSVSSIQFTISHSIFTDPDVCEIDGNYYLPLRARVSLSPTLGPYGAANEGEVEDHLLVVNLASTNFCEDNGGPPSLADLVGSGLIGAPLQLVTSDFVPAPYQAQMPSPVWYLDRTLLGSTPTLTIAQLAAIESGVSTLWVAASAGAVGISPSFPIVESTAMLNQLTGLGITGTELAPYLDLDGDSWSSLVEFALGSSPLDAGSGPVAQTSLEANSGTSQLHLGISYLRRTGGSTGTGGEYTADGITYSVEATKDLASWAEMVSPDTVPTGLGTPPAGYEWAFHRMNDPQNALDLSFMRLKIE